MTDRLPSVKQITSAQQSLRQAHDLAVQIEALDGYPSDERMACYRRQLVTNLDWAALKLGFELRPIINTMGR